MKHSILILIAAAMMCVSCKSGVTVLESQQDTFSWVMGEYLAQNIISSGIQIDKEKVLRAVEATLNKEKQPISDETFEQVLYYLQGNIEMQQREQMQQQRGAAQERQEQYFAKLLQDKPNLKRHKAGFYYEELRPGNGANAKLGTVVVFDYRGINCYTNQVSDATYNNREPVTHVVGNPMFSGLIEAFQLMNEGSQYRFYFPFECAFDGSGTASIPAFTPVIYEIELKEIKK